MCAIIDANVHHEVFGDNRPEAGRRFFEWIDSKPRRLVVGGQLLAELNRTPARKWIHEAIMGSKVHLADEDQVENKSEQVKESGQLRSDDPHVIALAQVSGARLLYSNDKKLHHDFKNQHLIKAPRGKIYSTNDGGKITREHQRLLSNRKLCLGKCFGS